MSPFTGFASKSGFCSLAFAHLAILLAIDTIPVFLMGAVRFLVAGALIYVWSIRLGDRRGDRPGLRQWGAAAIVGGALFLAGNTGVAWAETRVDTGVASLVIATMPLWIRLAIGHSSNALPSRPVMKPTSR